MAHQTVQYRDSYRKCTQRMVLNQTRLAQTGKIFLFSVISYPTHSIKSLVLHSSHIKLFSLFKSIFERFYLFIFRQREREGEREGEKHHCVFASHVPPTGDLACNPGMCLTGNQTRDPLVLRMALDPLSHTSQRCVLFYKEDFPLNF